MVFKLGNNSNIMPYQQAKEIITKSIDDYTLSSDQQLPELNIKYERDNVNILFNLSSSTDLFSLLSQSVSKIASSYSDNPQIKTYSSGKIKIETKNDFTIEIYNNELKELNYNSKSIEFNKKNNLTTQEIDLIIEAYKLGNPVGVTIKSAKQKLLDLGIKIYEADKNFTWDYISGYEEVKKEIKDTVILSLKHPDIYESIARSTRKIYESNRPKAVLFEGPPGTGKTTSARIIAGEIDSPLIYLPVESIMSKWYGESENRLSNVFDAAKELGNTIIFLDEIDSLATSRDGNIHEATRRVLSVLLRKIDGFEANESTILIGATNKKDHLDPALLSRFDLSLYFPLPNNEERKAIFSNYAKHIQDSDLERLANNSEGVSGRNIKDICEHAERRHASNLIQGKVNEPTPSLDLYLSTLKSRQQNGI